MLLFAHDRKDLSNVTSELVSLDHVFAEYKQNLKQIDIKRMVCRKPQSNL